jgi:hypothetical protein
MKNGLGGDVNSPTRPSDFFPREASAREIVEFIVPKV